MHLDAKVREIFVESCLEQLKDIEARILDLEHAQGDSRDEQVTRIFRAAHSIKGDAGSMGLDTISTYAHSIENVLQLVRERLLPVSQQVINELLHAFDRLKTAITSKSQDDSLEADSKRLDELFHAAVEYEQQTDLQNGQMPPGELGFQRDLQQERQSDFTPDGQELGHPDTAGAHRQQAGKKPRKEDALPSSAASGQQEEQASDDHKVQQVVDRVSADEKITRVTIPAEQLDILVDRVGELAIAQTRLGSLAREERDSKFLPVAEEIEALSALLRDQVLGLRLLPLEVSHAKLRRLVRDLCAELGKKAEFVMSGQNTELDKKLIEELNTPLIHLLRNAVDHGIEPPHIREYQDKPPQGVIEVAASQLGGEVLIEVKDDGKGIDGERLRQLAINKGLLDPDAELNEQQQLELIFLPGLTTAEKLSDVSGRGVGMDAVKASVQTLRGKIEVRSTRGQGTTFSIQLPVSMAIIDCLRVQVGGDDYFMHLDHVEECIEQPAQVSGLECAPHSMSLRGEHLPLVCLREFFEVPGQRPFSMQVVVVRSNLGRLGIVVDHVVGQQQAVLRHLGPAVGKVPGILGATVTEQGVMGLILDMPALAQTAHNEEQQRWA